MRNSKPKRLYMTLTQEQKELLQEVRKKVEKELPELLKRDRLARIAKKEASFSGELRRAIHSSKLLLPTIAERANIPILTLDCFLTGEEPLPSDKIDCLLKVLGYRPRLVRTKA